MATQGCTCAGLSQGSNEVNCHCCALAFDQRWVYLHVEAECFCQRFDGLNTAGRSRRVDLGDPVVTQQLGDRLGLNEASRIEGSVQVVVGFRSGARRGMANEVQRHRLTSLGLSFWSRLSHPITTLSAWLLSTPICPVQKLQPVPTRPLRGILEAGRCSTDRVCSTIPTWARFTQRCGRGLATGFPMDPLRLRLAPGHTLRLAATPWLLLRPDLARRCRPFSWRSTVCIRPMTEAKPPTASRVWSMCRRSRLWLTTLPRTSNVRCSKSQPSRRQWARRRRRSGLVFDPATRQPALALRWSRSHLRSSSPPLNRSISCVRRLRRVQR